MEMYEMLMLMNESNLTWSAAEHLGNVGNRFLA